MAPMAAIFYSGGIGMELNMYIINIEKSGKKVPCKLQDKIKILSARA